MDSLFASAWAGAFAGLAAFASVFLFVTGTFNFSGAAFAAARDEVFAFDATAFGATGFATADFVAGFASFAPVLPAAVLGAALTAVRAGVLAGVFAVLATLTAALFFTAGFAIDLPDAALVAAALGFFAAELAACVCFAGFFIAFAMESIQMVALVRRGEVRLVEPMVGTGPAFSRATLLERFPGTTGRNSLRP